jgi:hypothetical protein
MHAEYVPRFQKKQCKLSSFVREIYAKLSGRDDENSVPARFLVGNNVLFLESTPGESAEMLPVLGKR